MTVTGQNAFTAGYFDGVERGQVGPIAYHLVGHDLAEYYSGFKEGLNRHYVGSVHTAAPRNPFGQVIAPHFKHDPSPDKRRTNLDATHLERLHPDEQKRQQMNAEDFAPEGVDLSHEGIVNRLMDHHFRYSRGDRAGSKPESMLFDPTEQDKPSARTRRAKQYHQDGNFYHEANSYARAKAKEHGLHPRQVAGVIAALSPGTDWDRGIAQVDHVLAHHKEYGHLDHIGTAVQHYHSTIDPGNEAGVDRNTKSNYAKAFHILRHDGSDDGDYGADKHLGGHKVRSFFNNIIDPHRKQDHDSVTMDRHAVSAAVGGTLGGDRLNTLFYGHRTYKNPETGEVTVGRTEGSAAQHNTKGTYAHFASAYREAHRRLTDMGEDAGATPAHFQAKVWCRWRKDVANNAKKRPEDRRIPHYAHNDHEVFGKVLDVNGGPDLPDPDIDPEGHEREYWENEPDYEREPSGRDYERAEAEEWGGMDHEGRRHRGFLDHFVAAIHDRQSPDMDDPVRQGYGLDNEEALDTSKEAARWPMAIRHHLAKGDDEFAFEGAVSDMFSGEGPYGRGEAFGTPNADFFRKSPNDDAISKLDYEPHPPDKYQLEHHLMESHGVSEGHFDDIRGEHADSSFEDRIRSVHDDLHAHPKGGWGKPIDHTHVLTTPYQHLEPSGEFDRPRRQRNFPRSRTAANDPTSVRSTDTMGGAEGNETGDDSQYREDAEGNPNPSPWWQQQHSPDGPNPGSTGPLGFGEALDPEAESYSQQMGQPKADEKLLAPGPAISGMTMAPGWGFDSMASKHYADARRPGWDPRDLSPRDVTHYEQQTGTQTFLYPAQHNPSFGDRSDNTAYQTFGDEEKGYFEHPNLFKDFDAEDYPKLRAEKNMHRMNSVQPPIQVPSVWINPVPDLTPQGQAQFHSTALQQAQAVQQPLPQPEWLMKGSGASPGPSDGDIAKAARAKLAALSAAEQDELIKEGEAEGVRARNYDLLRLEGTHYLELEARLQAEEETAEDLFW